MKYFFPLLTLAVLVVACNSAEVEKQYDASNSAEVQILNDASDFAEVQMQDDASDFAEVQMLNGGRLNIGTVRPGDIWLGGRSAIVNAIPNVIQTQDVVFTGSSRTFISAINAYQVGWNQYATARVIRGGVGYSYVTLRVQSARGYGFNLNVNIWGRN